MTFVVHAATLDSNRAVGDAIAMLEKDVKKMKSGLRLRFGKQETEWKFFVIVPEGITLYTLFGTPDRPYASALKLDKVAPIPEEFIQEALNRISTDGIAVGRLERFEHNPLLEISQPHYVYSMKARRS